jgi:hypothetical protein
MRKGRQEEIEEFKFMMHAFLRVLRALAVNGLIFLFWSDE